MNFSSSPQNSLNCGHSSPSNHKNSQFSTPPVSLHLSKDSKWLNDRISKKEYKSLCEKGLRTVSKKLRFEENENSGKNMNSESMKILKLR